MGLLSLIIALAIIGAAYKLLKELLWNSQQIIL